MTRWTKLGGGAVVLAIVCLAGWHLVSGSSVASRLRRRLPRTVRRLFAPKPTLSERMANLPNLYLWAWERPEDLQFLGNRKVGVAFLAKTIYLSDSRSTTGAAELDAVNICPRMQPLRIVPGTPLMAVVRIETLRGARSSGCASNTASSTSFAPAQTARIAQEIAATAQITGVNAIQIDFDATMSEHIFYRDLLIDVRQLLPQDFPLSVTALASWCIGDRWLTQLPAGTIDEAVPMLFRMGQGGLEVTHYLAAGNTFTVPTCSTSFGLSTDEPFSRDIISGKISELSATDHEKRIYIFSPRAWQQPDTEKLLNDISREAN